MPPVSVLIKPASSKCNLKCKYCFYHDVANSRAVADFGLMSLDTAELLIRKVLKFAEGYATFSFQGGEPTVCGLDFFKSVVRLQDKLNVNKVAINNCIQTNGILIDEKWAEFLHDNRFLVGLSLDGTPDLHDKYRVDAKGQGTHERVMKTVELFNKYRVDYNILFVVTDATANRPEPLYDYFKANNFNFLQFMPCIDPGDSARGLHDYSLSPLGYTLFLKGFFKKWADDFLGGREVSVRYFDNLVRMVMGAPVEICSLHGSCQCQFVFEADGGVYPCDFYVTDEWKLGNIRDKELLQLYNSDRCKSFIKSSLSVDPACNTCSWKALCRGGCRRDRDNTLKGELEKNYYCQAFSEFLPYTYPRLVDIAKYVQKVNSQPKSG